MLEIAVRDDTHDARTAVIQPSAQAAFGQMAPRLWGRRLSLRVRSRGGGRSASAHVDAAYRGTSRRAPRCRSDRRPSGPRREGCDTVGARRCLLGQRPVEAAGAGGDVYATLIERLQRLPSIGARSARRLAEHLLRIPEDEALALAEAIRDVRTRLKPCSLCRAPEAEDPCHRCRNPKRRDDILLVLESLRDLEAVERMGAFDGRFWILGGRYQPADDLDEESLRVKSLIERIRTFDVEEVVLGTQP